MTERASRMRRVWAFLDERLGLSVLKYDVPEHANAAAYTLGGVAVVGFAVLVLTGIVLTQFYHPSPDDANGSVRAIAASPVLGWLRSVHAWTAQVTLGVVLLHLVRVFITAAYKRPRELQWVVGVLLLGVTVAFFFTGTVIKWDEEGSEALRHNDEVANLLSSLGFWFAGPYLSAEHVLVRLYALHVSLLPLALGALLIGHFYLVKHHKIAPQMFASFRVLNPPLGVHPREPLEERRVPFRLHLRAVGFYGAAGMAAVALLALAFPAPLGPAPIDGLEVTKPPWPFLWLYGIENYLGIDWLFPATLFAFAALLAVPAVDRVVDRAPEHRKWVLGLGFAFALVAFGLAFAAALSPVQHHL